MSNPHFIHPLVGDNLRPPEPKIYIYIHPSVSVNPNRNKNHNKYLKNDDEEERRRILRTFEVRTLTESLEPSMTPKTTGNEIIVYDFFFIQMDFWIPKPSQTTPDGNKYLKVFSQSSPYLTERGEIEKHLKHDSFIKKCPKLQRI